MQKTEIERKIRAFLVNNFMFGRAEALNDEGSLLGGVIDSTGVIELVMFLQDQFAITVEDEEVAWPENFESLQNIVAYVEGKLRGQAAGSRQGS